MCDSNANECVVNPPVGKKWYDTIEDISNEIQALGCATLAQAQEQQFPADVIDFVSKAKAIVQESDKERDKLLDNDQNAKRRRLLDAYDCNGNSSNVTYILSITTRYYGADRNISVHENRNVEL